MLIIAVISLALIVVDYRLPYLDPVRRTLNTVMTPIQRSVDLPYAMAHWAGSAFATRQALREENEALKARVLILEAQTLKLASLSAEVSRLRDLLNASGVVDESVVVAEIIGVDPDPYVHEVVINKGDASGAFVGQPVLDSKGLVGQIIETSKYTSRVLMISDSSHAVPVQVNRNGVRAIAFGGGSLDLLELVDVSETTDIQVGDLLVSSGLGGRFPVGYPVGTVTSLTQEPGQPFVRVRVKPAAELNRSRHVLLVFKRELRPEARETKPEAQATPDQSPAPQSPAS